MNHYGLKNFLSPFQKWIYNQVYITIGKNTDIKAIIFNYKQLNPDDKLKFVHQGSYLTYYRVSEKLWTGSICEVFLQSIYNPICEKCMPDDKYNNLFNYKRKRYKTLNEYITKKIMKYESMWG